MGVEHDKLVRNWEAYIHSSTVSDSRVYQPNRYSTPGEFYGYFIVLYYYARSVDIYARVTLYWFLQLKIEINFPPTSDR